MTVSVIFVIGGAGLLARRDWARKMLLFSSPLVVVDWGYWTACGYSRGKALDLESVLVSFVAVGSYCLLFFIYLASSRTRKLLVKQEEKETEREYDDLLRDPQGYADILQGGRRSKDGSESSGESTKHRGVPMSAFRPSERRREN